MAAPHCAALKIGVRGAMLLCGIEVKIRAPDLLVRQDCCRQ
jgi:hypothetical protein